MSKAKKGLNRVEKTIADVVGNMPETDRKWSRTAAVKATYPSAQEGTIRNKRYVDA